MRSQFTCSRCGAAFLQYPSQVGKHRRFCSPECRASRPSEITLSEDGAIARIALCSRDGSIRDYTTIDAADASWASQWRWCLGTWGYVVRNIWRDGANDIIRLHRDMLGLVPGDGLEVDHIDRDRLNNRRSNLRIVPKQAQAQNVPGRGGTSSFRGVSWDKTRNKWTARMRMNGGRYLFLGRFSSEEEAAEVARAARASLMPYATD